MSPLPEAAAKSRVVEVEEENERHIFALGICILFAWMFVIILCASPQLFRDLIKRYLCCCWYRTEHRTAKKVKEAQERLRRVSQNFLGTQLAVKPSSILVHQVMGPGSLRIINTNRHFITEPIIEEQRATSLAPSENCALEMDDEFEVQLIGETHDSKQTQETV